MGEGDFTLSRQDNPVWWHVVYRYDFSKDHTGEIAATIQNWGNLAQVKAFHDHCLYLEQRDLGAGKVVAKITVNDQGRATQVKIVSNYIHFGKPESEENYNMGLTDILDSLAYPKADPGWTYTETVPIFFN